MTKFAAQTGSSVDASARRNKKSRGESASVRNRRLIEASALHQFITDLNLKAVPSIHINGPAFASAIVTVDFGAPLEPVKLTSDENAEISERLRELTRTVISREVPVQIETDTKNGLVYWSRLS
jgi:type IV secretory pathway ATPase VirB11/archaellum biosynthesis ATPase